MGLACWEDGKFWNVWECGLAQDCAGRALTNTETWSETSSFSNVCFGVLGTEARTSYTETGVGATLWLWAPRGTRAQLSGCPCLVQCWQRCLVSPQCSRMVSCVCCSEQCVSLQGLWVSTQKSPSLLSAPCGSGRTVEQRPPQPGANTWTTLCGPVPGSRDPPTCRGTALRGPAVPLHRC